MSSLDTNCNFDCVLSAALSLMIVGLMKLNKAIYAHGID